MRISNPWVLKNLFSLISFWSLIVFKGKFWTIQVTAMDKYFLCVPAGRASKAARDADTSAYAFCWRGTWLM